MKILVVGNGGREHAIAWKIAQSPHVTDIFVAPGNAGTAHETKSKNVPIASDDISALIDFAKKNVIDFTIIGPEAPLVAGIVDAFFAAGLKCFGPTAKAAQLEGSKAFSKAFLKRHGIPTAHYAEFTQQQLNAAKDYLTSHFNQYPEKPIVIKADGLAAGKGVVITTNLAEAHEVIESMLKGKFGKASECVVIEEFLTGEEASFIVMVDGEHVLPLATSQDHKARDNGDRGPNTGGMGAYSPAPIITDEMHQRVMETIIWPTVRGLKQENIPYTGFLYAGLMIDAEGIPQVLEFNCRLGDPETQAILFRLRSDLVELCEAAFEQHLDAYIAQWDERVALGVVLVSDGYPDDYPQGEVISGLPACDLADTKVFHAGTREEAGKIVTSGGRVLCCTALGNTVLEAQRLAYRTAEKIHWAHHYYRTDIGYRAIRQKS